MSSTIFDRARPAASVVKTSLTGTRLGSFWLEDLEPRTGYPALTGDLRCNLAIVGGGYLGLWSAVLAKQQNPDARVLLLEARTVGWAASGRNGGFCEASLTHGDDNGRSRWPKEIDRLTELGNENLDEIERAVADLGIDCDFERTGSIDLAIEEHQIEWLREEPTGENVVFLDESAVRAEVASPTYLAGVWHRRSTALVHPGKLAAELARVATDLGVEIFEHSLVQSVDTARHRPAQGARVVTAGGTVTAQKVALATNVFPSLLKRNKLATVPVYDYVLMTEPLDASQLAAIGWQNRQGLSDLANQFHYYRLSADNRILFGGYDAVYHYGRKVRTGYENRPETFEKLSRHFFTTFPQLAGMRFSHKWAGAIDTSTQFCAFFGQARGGRISYAAGFTGLGVGATHFAAQVMLDQLADRTTDRTELAMVRGRPLSFPPEPIASAGIQATRWALNRADHNRGKRNALLKTLDALGLGFDS
ncbi:FAD-binding oxidoreductase [Cryobacterium sp. TMS1-13-1]|uniref:NAD(P)/FAD-dependent oxidoreductase n=1 Tax=Cryobacterium sp. TMS1-13-1 TaxID=1259220 RepID=UPI00106CBE99|nr:FAD-dependent oxidoreductase [Cryobacterium sp. TMS1-13-1]TFD22580.1 FAD-dependent oxidoreductase [Cryobacterium sp. TMS1-13-1]